MTRRFTIEPGWLARENGDAIERSTLAELTICVGDRFATEVEDFLARTVRRSARLSAYDLALWFAANWWRLRWEPERNDLSWKMSHMIGAVGGGYVWPDLTFVADGETVTVRSRPTRSVEPQPIRYLGYFDEELSASEFEQGIDGFVDSVIARLAEAQSHDSELVRMWTEVLGERRDPKLGAWRKLEAMLGYDPDEAPEGSLETLQKMEGTCGADALNELAAASGANASDHLDLLWREVRPNAVAARISDFGGLRRRIRASSARSPKPWQRAEQVAGIARSTWGVATGPVSTDDLASMLEISPQAIRESATIGHVPHSAAFRNGVASEISIFITKRHPTGRRFALARLLGDHLDTMTAEEKLLPATDAKTARQKFQRAFAQEFLCPFADLQEYLDTDHPTEDDIEAAATHFDVSPLAIRTTLVNKKQMDRETLDV